MGLSLALLSEMAVMQILIPFSLLLLVSGRPQLQAFPNPAHTSLQDPSLSAHPNAAHTSALDSSLSAHPNAAHTSLQDLSLSAHPNAAHTSPLDSSLSAHPNAAHTRISDDCARFTGAFPCAPGDSACETDYKTSGCGR